MRPLFHVGPFAMCKPFLRVLFVVLTLMLGCGSQVLATSMAWNPHTPPPSPAVGPMTSPSNEPGVSSTYVEYEIIDGDALGTYHLSPGWTSLGIVELTDGTWTTSIRIRDSYAAKLWGEDWDVVDLVAAWDSNEQRTSPLPGLHVVRGWDWSSGPVDFSRDYADAGGVEVLSFGAYTEGWYGPLPTTIESLDGLLIPEPGMLALAGVGAAAFMLRRR